MIKKTLISLSFIISFLACKKKSIEIKPNEEIEFYSKKSNQILKKTIHKIGFDSIYYYYNNGSLFKKGKQFKQNQKFGIWELYDPDSKLREIREWFTIKGKSRVNRVWHLNKNGDTLALRHKDSIYKQTEFLNDTTYYRNTVYDVIFFNRDTIKLNEPIRGYIEIGSRILSNYPNNHVRAYIAKEKNNYNFDFSNERQVKLDTFYDLTIDKVNQKWFKGAKHNQLVVIGKWFDSIGDKTIRGYYEQYSYNLPFKKEKSEYSIDSVIGYKTFFEKKVYVKDSID